MTRLTTTVVLIPMLAGTACEFDTHGGLALDHGAAVSADFGVGERFDEAAFRASLHRLERWRKELVSSGFTDRGGSRLTVVTPTAEGETAETVLDGRVEHLGKVRITFSHRRRPDTTSYTRVRVQANVHDEESRAAFQRLRERAFRVLTGKPNTRAPADDRQLRLRERPRT